LYKYQYPADFQWVEDVENHYSNLMHQDQVTLFYAGISLKSTAFNRLKSDTRITHENALWNRFKNFNNATNSQDKWRSYNVTNINLSNVVADTIEGIKILGYIEDIIIKAAGVMSLNSANGGFLCDFEINDNIRNSCQKFIKEDVKFVSKQPIEPFKGFDATISRHFIHYVDFIENAHLHRREISMADRDILINQLIDQSVYFGKIRTVLVGKDITEAGLLNKVPYFSKEYAFNGPTFHR
jgi:hypothetical protein